MSFTYPGPEGSYRRSAKIRSYTPIDHEGRIIGAVWYSVRLHLWTARVAGSKRLLGRYANREAATAALIAASKE